ncbi:MAG: outer membrane protein assembly factor BamB family protein [Aggregatilineales bacterium]
MRSFKTGRYLLWAIIGIMLVAALPLIQRPTRAAQTIIQSADWPVWGHDLGNQRYNGAEKMLTPTNVGSLTLKWTFAFPDTMVAANEPIVIGNTVYVGSWNGHVYALDTATGQPRWDFFDGVTGKNVPVRASIVVVDDLVVFGDMAGRVFALNQANGTLAWLNDKIESHPARQITGSLVAYGDRVYVPMSSAEESAASGPGYACCTFRGSLTALNARDGSIAWRFFTTDPPQALHDPTDLRDQFGPSGAAIWSTPAIDPDAGLIYVTTGNSYSAPDSPHSDAILALNLADGSLRWTTQVLTGDIWNNSCQQNQAQPDAQPSAVPCAGTDDDFSSSPLLATVNGRNLVIGIQKNGHLTALDVLTGQLTWQQSVGQETAINWGASFDGQYVYAGDASYKRNGQLYALDPSNGQIVWQTAMPTCIPGPGVPADQCWSGNMNAISSTPGIIWTGAMDGQAYAFDTTNGKTLWTYNTARIVQSVNGVAGHGGSIATIGVTVANGQVYVASGYNQWNPSFMLGNVLFAFGLP